MGPKRYLTVGTKGGDIGYPQPIYSSFVCHVLITATADLTVNAKAVNMLDGWGYFLSYVVGSKPA